MTPLYSSTDTEVAHGLKGVVSHATQLSEVDGQAGRLVIHGYGIPRAGRQSFVLGSGLSPLAWRPSQPPAA